MIQCQILQTNITRTVLQTVRRITKEILGVKGLEKIEAPADDSRLRVEQGISRIFDKGFAILAN